MTRRTEMANGDRRRLTFEDDPGARRSAWIAGGLLALIVVWLGSGVVLPDEPAAPALRATGAEPVAVAVRRSSAAPVTLTFEAEGQALPDRDTALRAEASGEVAELLVEKGDRVAAGALVARLSSAALAADLRRAQEELERAEREFANARALLDRGVATTDRLVQARAALAAAEAQVTAAEEALEATDIVAPFAGRIETLELDAGEFVAAGAAVGRIVDTHPLTVSFRVPQQELTRIESGQEARVTFITGETRTGRVAFVGSAAAAETRTFLAEVEVANPDGAIPAGISAEILIPTGEEMAHFLSPSVVSLGPDGETGVKTVEDGRVVFHEIALVRAEVDGIWVTGLPEEAEVITVGQGFVRPGERVRARPEAALRAAGGAAE